MAVPKRRSSSTRGKKRRTHFKLKNASITDCPNCFEKKRPHRVCPHCGFYKRQDVIKVDDI